MISIVAQSMAGGKSESAGGARVSLVAERTSVLPDVPDICMRRFLAWQEAALMNLQVEHEPSVLPELM